MSKSFVSYYPLSGLVPGGRAQFESPPLHLDPHRRIFSLSLWHSASSAVEWKQSQCTSAPDSPPTLNLYLCLCRLLHGSLPFLPIHLFYVVFPLARGAPFLRELALFSWPEMFVWTSWNKIKTWIKLDLGLDFNYFNQQRVIKATSFAWWPLRAKEGQNCHPGRYWGRLQRMQSSGDQISTNLRNESDPKSSQIQNSIGNVQCHQSDQPKESDKQMEYPGQKHKHSKI